MPVMLISNNEPIYSWRCDLCDKTIVDKWQPENWVGFTITIVGGQHKQLTVCQDCQTTKTITHLMNKVISGFDEVEIPSQ